MSKYLTFPVAILKNAITDIHGRIEEAFAYCLYYHYQDSYGTDSERLKRAADKLEIKFGNINKSYKNGKKLFESIPENSPKTSISKDMMFDFFKNEKTEFEVVTFLAFAAIRSIIQKQSYIRINNKYLLSRMSGNAKRDDPLCDLIKPYSKRYQLDKIKKELQLNWGLKLYGVHMRGYYVSFKRANKFLAIYAEENKITNKFKKLQNEKKMLAIEAKEEIKKRIENAGIDYHEFVSTGLIKVHQMMDQDQQRFKALIKQRSQQ